jgi:hypothetical protein
MVTLLPDGRLMITVHHPNNEHSDIYYIDKDNERYSELLKHAKPLYTPEEEAQSAPMVSSKEGRRKSAIIALFLTLLLVLGYIIYSILNVHNAPMIKTITVPVNPKQHTVLYEVEGTARVVNIVYTTHNKPITANDLAVPVMTLTGDTGVAQKMYSGDILKIVATDITDSGTLTCRISLDGAERIQVRSQPNEHIVTCFGGLIP